MKIYLKKVFHGENLTMEEAERAMDWMMSGQAKPEEIAGFLGALAGRGETPEEIVGSVRSMRRHAVPLPVRRRDLIDVCGTGGDGSQSFNISTTNALLLAAAGLGVVKHGNRAVSSASGSADVLEALGIPIEGTPENVASRVDQLGFGFLYAPLFHPAMKHVGPTRRALQVRTLFNLLGPLANPAPVRKQVVGVFAEKWLDPMAHALKHLGCEEAFVVWGEDGLDEISIEAPTQVVHLKGGSFQRLTLKPEDFGVSRASLSTLKGDDATTNAKITAAILTGKDRGPRLDVVLINAAAALKVAGVVRDFESGMTKLRTLIDSGSAAKTLSKLQNNL